MGEKFPRFFYRVTRKPPKIPHAPNSITNVTVSVKDFDKLPLEVRSFADELCSASETAQNRQGNDPMPGCFLCRRFPVCNFRLRK